MDADKVDPSKLFEFKSGVVFAGQSSDKALFYLYGQRVFVRGELIDDDFEKLCVLLKTPHSIDQIVSAIDPLAKSRDNIKNKVAGVIEKLKENRFLNVLSNFQTQTVTSAPHVIGSQPILQRFSDHVENQNALQQKLDNFSLAILDLGQFGSCLTESLACAGIRQHHFISDAETSTLNKVPQDLLLITGTTLAWDKLLSINEQLLRAKQTFLLLRRDYYGGTVGPTVGFSGGPCLNCAFTRQSKMSAHVNLSPPMGLEHTAPTFEPFLKMLCQIAAVECFKFATDLLFAKSCRGAYELDGLNYRIAFHDILPVPGCPSCASRVKPETELNIETDK